VLSPLAVRPDSRTILFDTVDQERYDSLYGPGSGAGIVESAELCLREGCVNSAASRAYYAMFQAAQVALAHAGVASTRWSHSGLQAAFATELIQRRKIYPAVFRNALASGLEARQEADYGHAGVSQKMAQRLLQRAAAFVAAVEEVISHGTTS
jgi:uncharacterized protein (UPF0332 family)